MRSVIISIIISIVMVSGSLLYSSNLEKVSSELSEINASVGKRLKENDFEAANNEITKLTEYLDKKRAVLDATGNHEEMDNIEMNIFEMLEYAKGEQQADALSRNRVLEFLFEHLPTNYKLKWENIL